MKYQPLIPKYRMIEHSLMYPNLIQGGWVGRCTCGWKSDRWSTVGEARVITRLHITERGQ